jgi:hypothetical protein
VGQEFPDDAQREQCRWRRLGSGPLAGRQLFKVPGVPFPLSPSPAGLWQVDEAAGTVAVAAQAHTDIFIDPGDGFADGSSGGDAGISLNAESMLNPRRPCRSVIRPADLSLAAGESKTFVPNGRVLCLDGKRGARDRSKY